jgi:hypothetical protein
MTLNMYGSSVGGHPLTSSNSGPSRGLGNDLTANNKLMDCPKNSMSSFSLNNIWYSYAVIHFLLEEFPGVPQRYGHKLGWRKPDQGFD